MFNYIAITHLHFFIKKLQASLNFVSNFPYLSFGSVDGLVTTRWRAIIVPMKFLHIAPVDLDELSVVHVWICIDRDSTLWKGARWVVSMITTRATCTHSWPWMCILHIRWYFIYLIFLCYFIGKSKDYDYGIWVYKVLGIWKGFHRVKNH